MATLLGMSRISPHMRMCVCAKLHRLTVTTGLPSVALPAGKVTGW